MPPDGLHLPAISGYPGHFALQFRIETPSNHPLGIIDVSSFFAEKGLLVSVLFSLKKEPTPIIVDTNNRGPIEA
jgi:hypothetical protein